MMSNYMKGKMLNWLKQQTFPPEIEICWLAFFSDSVNAAGVGTEVSNIVNGGRASILWSTVQNNTYIRNNQKSLANASGVVTVVSVGIYDSVTGGNLLFFGNLTNPFTTVTGQGRIIPADTIRITLT